LSTQDEIELYKVMVETVTANEARRQQINSVFISLIAAGFAALGAINNLDPIYLAIPAAAVCALWYNKIQYLKLLAKAKFKVICDLEKGFSSQPFADEWQHFESLRKGRRGLSELELTIPLFIGFSSFGYIAGRLGNVLLNLLCP